MKKEIIIKMPKDTEDIQVYKELSLDNRDSILINPNRSLDFTSFRFYLRCIATISAKA